MMYIASYQTIDEGLARLEERIAKQNGSLKGAHVSMALFREADHFRVSYCRVVFSDQIADLDITYQYPSVVLFKRWFNLADARAFAAALLHNEWSLSGVPVHEEYRSTQENTALPVENSLTGWKEYIFSSRGNVDRRISYRGNPLVAYGNPAFDTDGRAVAEWVLGDPGRESFFRGSEQVEIIVQEKIARIESGHWTEDGIDLKIELYCDPGSLILKVVECAGANRKRSEYQVPTPTSIFSNVQVKFTCEKLDAIQIFLVNKNDELLDYAKLNPAYEDYETPDGQLSMEDMIRIDLNGGESDTVEFKPWIDPNNGKENQVINTVVAFANTNGGHLYIGVEDNGTVQKGSVLKSLLKSSLDEAQQKARDRIKHLIRENIKPMPNVSVESTIYAGEPLILVIVEEGDNAPYASHGNDVFIRRGATNRKPEPTVELLNLYIKGNKVQRK